MKVKVGKQKIFPLPFFFTSALRVQRQKYVSWQQMFHTFSRKTGMIQRHSPDPPTHRVSEQNKQTNKHHCWLKHAHACKKSNGEQKEGDKQTYRDRETLTAGEALTQRNKSRVSKKRTDRKQVNKQPGCWEKKKNRRDKADQQKNSRPQRLTAA